MKTSVERTRAAIRLYALLRTGKHSRSLPGHRANGAGWCHALAAANLLRDVCRSATHDRRDSSHQRASGWAAHESPRDSTRRTHELRSGTYDCRRRSGNDAGGKWNQSADEGFRFFLCFGFRGSVAQVFHERFVVDPLLRIDLVLAFEFKLALALEFSFAFEFVFAFEFKLTLIFTLRQPATRVLAYNRSQIAAQRRSAGAPDCAPQTCTGGAESAQRRASGRQSNAPQGRGLSSPTR